MPRQRWTERALSKASARSLAEALEQPLCAVCATRPALVMAVRERPRGPSFVALCSDCFVRYR